MNKKLMNLAFVADAFVEDIVGGGEINNEELIKILSKDLKICKIKSQYFSLSDIEKYDHIIFGNFIGLNESIKFYLWKQKPKFYSIYEHDHKYCRSRNPAYYPQFKIPETQLININFYKNAKNIFCQSKMQMNIIKQNLKIDNLINLSGNLWPIPFLIIMEEMVGKEKNNTTAIINSPNGHKNTKGAIEYCSKMGYSTNLINQLDPGNFLKVLGKSERLVFIPKTPETLSRIVVEAKAMGLKVVGNKLIAALKEPWFKEKDLITILYNMRETIPEIVLRRIA